MHHQAKSATLHRSPLRPQLNQWVEERQFWEQQRLRRAQIVDTLAALVAQHTSTSRTNRATPQLRVEGSSICACYMCQFGRTKTRLSPFLPQKGCRQNFETHEVSFCKRPAIESVTLHAFSKQNTLFLYQPSLNFKQRKICFCYKICIVAKSARKCIIAKSASPSPIPTPPSSRSICGRRSHTASVWIAHLTHKYDIALMRPCTPTSQEYKCNLL